MQTIVTNYKGIEFVQISNLPSDQKAHMEESFDKKLIIKISIDGVILHDCIQLKDYRVWHEKYIRATDSKIMADELMFAVEVHALDFQQDVISKSKIDPEEGRGSGNLFLSTLVLKVE